MSDVTDPVSKLTTGLFVRFLLGDRQAILSAAGTRGLLGLGLLFVLSAGLAREYDAEDLWHEPWHVLLPLAASLVSSFLLFGLLRAVFWRHAAPKMGYRDDYHAFLGMYWLTAPLAWLYAIPGERFLSPLEAVQANVALLALVSVWRVLLITRVAAVWFGAPFLAILMPVMLFADSIVVGLTVFTALPKVMISMGGLRLGDVDRWLGGVAATVGWYALLTWPIWLIGLYMAMNATPWHAAAVPRHRVSRGLWRLAGFALAAGLALLPFGQPEQRLARQTDQLLEAGDIGAAVALIAKLRPEDFPPNWNPLPRIAELRHRPRASEVLQILERQPAAPAWVRAIYLEKFRLELDGLTFAHVGRLDDSEETDRVLELLETLPEGLSLVRERAEHLGDDYIVGQLNVERQRRIAALLKAAGAEK